MYAKLYYNISIKWKIKIVLYFGLVVCNINMLFK